MKFFEAMQALEARYNNPPIGVRVTDWPPGRYILLNKEGEFINEEGKSVVLNIPKIAGIEWELVLPKKTKKLTRWITYYGGDSKNSFGDIYLSEEAAKMIVGERREIIKIQIEVEDKE